MSSGTLLPWQPALWLAHPWGAVWGVAIPEGPPPGEVVARLHPEEQAMAEGMPAARLSTWVAGRLALAAALADLGAPREALRSTPRGAPALPRGFAGSLSHKKRMAAAMACVDTGARVGIDVEQAAPTRYDIARHVLRPEELALVDALPPDRRWRGVVARFSIKESIYKAIDPFVQRYVGFKEALVEISDEAQGEAKVSLSLAQGEGPFAVEATWAEQDGLFVTAARARLSGGPSAGA
jgi:4'-phosphopantetheinyl transferase EntD